VTLAEPDRVTCAHGVVLLLKRVLSGKSWPHLPDQKPVYSTWCVYEDGMLCGTSLLVMSNVPEYLSEIGVLADGAGTDTGAASVVATRQSAVAPEAAIAAATTLRVRRA